MDRENRSLEHKVELLKDPNNVCECVIASNSFSISNEKILEVISGVLGKLAKKDIERFWSSGIKVRLFTKARSPSYLK